ncbi:MAG: hypothetical protein ACLSVG_01115 [Clostridia bacterium]
MNGRTEFFQKAQPVWEAGKETELNTTLLFRAACPRCGSAKLLITGSACYHVFVNGIFQAVGPARAAHGYYRVDELQICLDREQNEIEIIVMGYACNSFCYTDQPSFLTAEVVSDKGVIAYTEAEGMFFRAAEWLGKIRKVQRYSFQRPFAEAYDFTREQYRDVKLACTQAKKYLPRGVFYGKYETESARSVIQKGAFSVSEKQQYYDDRSIAQIGPQLKGFVREELEILSTTEAQKLDPVIAERGSFPAAEVSVGKDSFVTYDMGKNLTGLIGFSIECDAPCEIYAVFDEILQGEEINFTRLTAANVILLKIARGRTAFLSIEPYTFRYIRIYCKGAGCVIRGLHLRRVGAPAPRKRLDSGNPKLQAIFDAAVETYRQNTFDIYMDCPSRERAGWLCDSFFTARVERVLTGKSEVERNFIENYILPERFRCLPEGMLPMCYPADHYDGVFIPNWAMWFVLELGEYQKRTGDAPLIARAKEKVYALLQYFRRFENEFGLLEKLESWVFLEWSKSNELVQDVNFPSNMLYAKMKRVISALYGDASLAAEADRLQSTIREMAYTTEGFFCDNAYRRDGKLLLSGEYTESCQYYAFHTQTATPELYPALWQRLVADFGRDRRETHKWENVAFANAFIGNYLRMDLLASYGSREEVLKNIEDYFYYMAEKTGTLWENDGDYASCNHGFASHVLYWFDRFGMIKDL